MWAHYNDWMPQEPISDPRLDLLRQWLQTQLRFDVVRLEPASSDASFRRYFRAWRRDGATRVVMDAPPDKEDTAPFLKVSSLLEGCGVHVPHIDAADASQGFVLLEDLGSEHFLTRLRSGGDADALYRDAFGPLIAMQTRGRAVSHALPPYDRAALEREMALMPEWFCERHLRLTLQPEDRELLASSFGWLATEALKQPRVFVHRDYHSRNLMVLPTRNPGVVDFQDALEGPAGYDLVSLLKDCYIDWPRERVERWVAGYRLQLAAAGGEVGGNDAEFLRWFDLIGVQRHIKVLGIFARLWYRDGKIGYLGDLPRTLDYVIDTVARHSELKAFAQWLTRRVLPEFTVANERELKASAAR